VVDLLHIRDPEGVSLPEAGRYRADHRPRAAPALVRGALATLPLVEFEESLR
jgi:hypothetical protein